MDKRELKLVGGDGRDTDMTRVDKQVARIMGISVATPPKSPTAQCSDRYLHDGRLYRRHHDGKREVWMLSEWSPTRWTDDALEIMADFEQMTLRSVGPGEWVAEWSGTLSRVVGTNPAFALISLLFKMQGCEREEWIALGRLWPDNPTDC